MKTVQACLSVTLFSVILTSTAVAEPHRHHSTVTYLRIQDDDDEDRLRIINFAIDEEILQTIKDRLELSAGQAKAVNSYFEVYKRAVHLIDKSTTKDLEERSLLGRPNELQRAAIEADTEPPWAEIDDANRQVLQARRVALLQTDQLLGEFYGNIRSILGDSQQERFDEIPNLVIRLVYCNMLNRREYRRDFNVHFDMRKLISEYARNNTTLARIIEELPYLDESGAGDDNAATRLQRILADYDAELAVWCQAIYRAERAPIRPDRKWLLYPSDPEFRQIGERWYRRYQLNSNSAASVAVLLEDIAGDEAEDQWVAAYNARFCPSLYSDSPADHFISWMATVPPETLPDNLRESVEAIYVDYVATRDPLRVRAVELGAINNRTHLTPNGSNSRESAYAVTRRVLSELNADTLRSLTATIPEMLREDWHKFASESGVSITADQ